MKYKIITLGCKVNEYESEVISNLLEGNEDLQIGIVSFSSYYNPSDSTDISQEATSPEFSYLEATGFSIPHV